MAGARSILVMLGAFLWTISAAHAAPDTATVERQVADARATMMIDPQAAATAAATAANNAEALPAGARRTLALATADWLRAEAALRLGRYEDGETFVATAMRQSPPGRTQLNGDILLTRGGLRTARGDVGGALRDFQSAFAAFQSVGNNRSQAITLMLIASLYSSGKDYERALRYLTQATEVYSGDPGMMVALYNNRGGVLQDLKRHAQAEKEFGTALSYARRMRSAGLIAKVLENMARNRLKEGQIGTADRLVVRGLAVATPQNLTNNRPQLLALAAEAALQRRQLHRAADLIEESFANVDPSTTEAAWLEPHLTAFRIYSRLGRYEPALTHLAAVKRIDDAATALATSTGSALMAARFDFANQELRIANLQAEELRRSVALEQARTRFQQLIFIGVAGATAIIIIVLAIALFTILRSRNQLRIARDGLAETNVALNKALAAKTEFLATTSHEIRTPLNGILGMTQVMLADPALDMGTRDRLDVVHGAGMTMRALVDDLLDVAKMETGKLTLEDAPYDFRATVGDATRLWQEQARAKQLDFRVDLSGAPGMVMGDGARLRQIIFNLLSNAIKFTDRGHVALSVATDTDRGEIAISVIDTGIGIPQAKREAIFESFRQADASTTRTYGGTGLGLTICRNLAEAMGGDILVESVVGQGSRFCVRLPLRPADDTEAQAEQPVSALLVLDRSPITRSMWRTLLERRAGRLVFAANVGEALDLIAADRIDRILIDDATLCADPDPAAALCRLGDAARRQGAETTLLWGADRDGRDAMAACVTRIAMKPIGGQSLVTVLFGQDCDGARSSPLVSQAA